MRVITASYARKHLAEVMGRVCDDHAPVTIVKRDGRAIVVIALEEYESWEETAYLLRSPANCQRLLASVAELAAGGGAERTLAP